jgi:cytochrome b pre-mRNA-processing protein 3
MLGILFGGLTTQPANGTQLFDALTAQARRPHWYLEGEVHDTLDGRFAVVATVAALTIVRLERRGEAGNAQSVALTERFIEVMESEHRELGLGDPSLGKTVRRLVGALGRRTEFWRGAVNGDRNWRDCTRHSLYKAEPAKAALDHSSAALKAFWSRLEATGLDDLADGRIP